MKFRFCQSALAALLMIVSFSGSGAAESIEHSDFTDINVSTTDGVMVIELASPPINGVSVRVLAGINAALDIVDSDGEIDAIVITGQDEMFSGGPGEITPGPGGISHATYAHQTFDRMETTPLPIVAALNGVVGQGGNELAMAADIRIVGET